MAKQQTDQSRYQSRYSPGTWITPAQYIAEYMCENLAKKDHKELYPKFWTNSEWQKFFVFQCILANRLLKKFKPEHIIKAIRLCSWAYSLNTKKLKDKIAELAKKNYIVSNEDIITPIEVNYSNPIELRPQTEENNLLSKLED